MTQQARGGKEGVFDAASDGEKQQAPSPGPHTTPTFEQHHNLHPQSTHTHDAHVNAHVHTRSRLGPGRPVGQEMLPYQIPVSCSRACREAFVHRPDPCMHSLPAALRSLGEVALFFTHSLFPSRPEPCELIKLSLPAHRLPITNQEEPRVVERQQVAEYAQDKCWINYNETLKVNGEEG